jgi:hypothetical protein
MTVAVVVVGMLVWTEQRRADDRLERLLCFERAHVTAAIAVMVPESRVDVDGRLDAVRRLGQQIDAC